MKTKICIAFIILLMCAMLAAGIYIDKKAVDDAYNYAISLIENCSYEASLEELEKANPGIIDHKDFKWDMNHDNLGECHKNTLPLYAYALAQLEYNEKDKNMATVNEYLDFIPSDYSGELCEEIKTFKGNFKTQYDEYLKEQKRKAEEQKRIEQEQRRIREQQEAERLKQSVPYVGMSESNINDTVLGTNYEIVHNYEYIKGKKIRANVYRFKKGNGIIFVARCLNGRVDSVGDYRADPWIIRSTTSSKSSNKKKSNPYDVYDYSDPEDFYYDNYDDFWDYEDAEDYYNEHHG